MKNLSFKKFFISTLTVTVVGVLLFGVNAALSQTPAASPPGDGIGPTFTGLNVTGSIRNETSVADPVTINDGLTVYSKLMANSNIEANANVIVTGNVEVADSIKNPNSVAGTHGAIAISTPPVKVEGDLKITDIEAGATDIPAGNLEVNGKIFNWKTKADGSDLPVSILDNLAVSYDLDVSGAIKNAVSGGDKPVKVNDSLDVTGTILNTATKDAEGMTAMNADGTPLQIDLPVTIDDNVVVNKDLSVKGKVTGNLSVTGKLTAVGGVGTFTRFISDSDGISSNGYTPYTVGKGVGTDKTLYCPTGSKVISCQVKPAEVTGYDIQNFSLSAYMDEALTYCKATVHNGSTTEKKFLIYQICFDSTQ